MATYCGDTICYDDNSYCCQDDAGIETCCVSYYYYQTWWFWFIWGSFLLILVSCFIGCFRACRRRSQPRYVILGNNQQPVYGSVVVSSAVHSQASMVPGPTAPVAPPAYAAYPQEKPPAYMANPYNYAPAPQYTGPQPQAPAGNM